MSEKIEMIELCALWQKEDKNGNTFFTGSLNGLDVIVFHNKHKTSDKHPDYRVYLKKKQKREDFHPQSGGGYAGGDEIPF